ncbi:MAG: hypothetical protein FJ279_06165, partial [Planctomycetes bacterium]|nr:hypothetical protein [Planctomycetota bacterium]
MNARAIVAFAILAVLRMGTAMSQVADETVGDFRVVVNERYESSVSYQGKAVVTRDASGLATPDWKTIFPSQAAKRNLARVDAPEGRQIVITCDDPAIGTSRKVITLTPRYVDYHLEFNVKPGVEKAHQSQWFVVLAAVEGGDYSVTTLTERKDGVFRSARGPTTLVNGARFATVPTAAGPMAFDFGDSDMGWHLDDYTNFWAKTYIFYNSKDLDPKLGCRRRVSFRIHPGSHEPPKPRFEPLSIAAASTTGFTDEKAGDRQGGWTDDGPNDMRQFPVGEQTFRGVPFSIVDPAKNGGRSCIALRGQAWKGYPPRDYFPESASIAVGKKATTLYFLQTCAWPATAGQSAARYVLRYEDGSTAETPLVCGYDLCDWFNIKDGDRCFVAWVSLARGGASYGVHVAWWRNPFPDKKIESLTFRSENTSAVPILLAVTLSDQEPRIFGEPVDASLDKTDVSTWFPFTFPWCEAEPGTATDVSFLLDPPAGKHGFVMARDGHFFFQNGKRAKFWGVNLDRVPCFPHRENADRIAAHLAKYGNNIVRLHCLESFQPTKENIFDQSHDDSLHLSPENMERLDYFLAQLKKRGIYVVIDLWGFRKFLPGDGVKDREAWQGRQVTSMQGAVIFNERLQELEREYARLLLTHVNPHTGLALKDDPQLALIELFNEVSLLVRWTWSAMPPSYVQELTEMWNTWLVGMYRSRDGLAQAWTNADGKCFLQAEEDPSKGTVRPFFDLYALGAPKDAPEDRLGDARVNDAIRFLYELEVKHSRMMRDHLRSLGVKVPIASTGALGETA